MSHALQRPSPHPDPPDQRDAHVVTPALRAVVGDGALIAASLDEPGAFAIVFDRHWPRIHRFCVSRAGAAGEDLAAEVFRIAFDERRRFDADADNAAPWLYGIATNLLRHWFRGQARGTAALARTDRDDARDGDDDALSRVEAQQLGPQLAAALASIAAPDRDALLLYAWADLTYAQIAAATAVPIGTVRSRINRARVQVRTHLPQTPTSPGHRRARARALTAGVCPGMGLRTAPPAPHVGGEYGQVRSIGGGVAESRKAAMFVSTQSDCPSPNVPWTPPTRVSMRICR